METKINFTFKPKSNKNCNRKATPNGFNGYGKQRSGQYVTYDTFSSYVNKAGIYYIKNKINNKIYIGSSKNIGSRLIKHFSQLRTGNHPNNDLLHDYNELGINAFDFNVFEYTENNLFEKERDYQLKYPFEQLYNLQISGTIHSTAQIEGWKHSNRDSHKTAEYRAKMSKIKSNRIGKFDKNTHELLETFECSDDVCSKYPIAKSTLLGCCNGSKKSGLGYVWRYLDKNNNIMLEGKGRKRTIIQDEEIV